MIRISRRSTRGRPRLLILRALGLGDLLTAIPALRALAAAFPRHERVLVAPAALVPLLAMLGDTVDAVVDADFRDRVGALPDRLAAPDVAVNLHGRGPQSHAALDALAPARLVAWHHRGMAPSGPRWRDDEPERARWCRLLESAGIPANPEDYLVRAPGDGIPAEFVGATIVHPGASAAARRWPARRWAAVARHEQQRGRTVIITGNAEEVELAKQVAVLGGIGGAWVLAGHTDLDELARLVAGAGRVACGDTGVAHLATAFGTPSVVLFGPTDPVRWGPPANGRHLVLWAGLHGDPHASRPDAGLLYITAEQVTGALDLLPG